MFFALVTVHLIADFVLQPDWMASAKRSRFSVLLLHAATSGLGVLVLAWLFWPQLYWPAVTLAILHLLIDWVKMRLETRFKWKPLIPFIADQVAHVLTIAGVMLFFGLDKLSLQEDTVRGKTLLIYAFAYSASVFLGYVLLKVIALSWSTRAPAKASSSRKYLGMLERALITTFVASGQFLLIGAAIIPRLMYEHSRLQDPATRRDQGLEMLFNFAIAASVGLLVLSR